MRSINPLYPIIGFLVIILLFVFCCHSNQTKINDCSVVVLHYAQVDEHGAQSDIVIEQKIVLNSDIQAMLDQKIREQAMHLTTEACQRVLVRVRMAPAELAKGKNDSYREVVGKDKWKVIWPPHSK